MHMFFCLKETSTTLTFTLANFNFDSDIKFSLIIVFGNELNGLHSP